MIHQATYRKYIHSYIGCICKKNVFVSPQVFYKSVFVVTLVAFVKKSPNVYGPKLVRRIGLDSSIWWYVLICWALGPKFLMRARQLKKGGTKWDFNGGHLHARKSEDQIQLPPISLTAAAGCWQACPCCPS